MYSVSLSVRQNYLGLCVVKCKKLVHAAIFSQSMSHGKHVLVRNAVYIVFQIVNTQNHIAIVSGMVFYGVNH